MSEKKKERDIRIQSSTKIIGKDRSIKKVRTDQGNLVLICEKLEIFIDMTTDLVEETTQKFMKIVDVVAGMNVTGADLTMMMDVKRAGHVAIDLAIEIGITLTNNLIYLHQGQIVQIIWKNFELCI